MKASTKRFVGECCPKKESIPIFIVTFFTILNIIFLCIAGSRNDFSIADTDFVFYACNKVLFDAAFMIFSILILKALFKTAIIPALFVTANVTLAVANIFLFYFGNTLVEAHHFALITPYSLTSFVPWYGLVAISVALIGIFIFSCFAIRRISFENIFQQSLFWLSSCIILFLIRKITYTTFIVSNMAIYFCARKFRFLTFDTVASLISFYGIPAVLILFFWGVFFFQILVKSKTMKMVLITFSLALLSTLFCPLADAVGLLHMQGSELDRFITEIRYSQLHYLSQNQGFNFVEKIVIPNLKPKSSKDSSVIGNDNDFKETIDHWHLPIDKQPANQLDLKPYSKIVYILAESASLEAFPCYNDKIKTPFADKFFCKKGYMDNMFTNLMTTASPTLQAVTVIFNSHPNFKIQENSGQINAFPHILSQNGYQTIFMRSTSKYYADENVIFKKMGFSEIIGREDFFKNEDLIKYIYGWGLEDRLLYDQAFNFIKERRHEKIFLTLLGTDTHPIDGKKVWRFLTYPKRDFGTEIDPKTISWLTSIDNMDYDIANFINKLEEADLFDETMLIVISADHSCPVNSVTEKIPGHPKTNTARMPFIILSKQPLQEIDRAQLASQLDIAPTIFHMLGISKPIGWWGESLFSTDRYPYSISYHKELITYADNFRELLIDPLRPKNEEERDFLELFNTIIYEENSVDKFGTSE